jgi:hypothetical protein
MSSKQRPDTLMQDRISQVEENSCNARPDHTLGHQRRYGRPEQPFECPVRPQSLPRRRNAANLRKVPLPDAAILEVPSSGLSLGSALASES